MKNIPSAKNLRFYFAPFFCLLFLVLPPSIAAQTNTDRQLALWKTFTPEGWNFKVSLPQEPEEVPILSQQAENVSTQGYELNTTAARYSIFIVKLAKPSATFEDIKQLAQEYAQQLPSGGFMVGDTFVATYKQNTRPNVIEEAVTIEKDGKTVQLKRFLTKSLFFQLQVTTPNLYAAPPQVKEIFQTEADKFFKSFQILDNKKPVTKGKGKTR